MDTLSFKTISANSATVKPEWLIIDAENKVLGRLASEVAKLIRGKHKPYYTPNTNCGDKVIVINADKIKLTGNKFTDKKYVRHTGYPGGQRITTPKEVLDKTPIRVVEMAVRGMLPKSRLGKQMFKNMFVYAGTEHQHEAQQPKEVKL
ncbi:MAG: 50S ribosomal protein L13 [Bacteroidota bacterium]